MVAVSTRPNKRTDGNLLADASANADVSGHSKLYINGQIALRRFSRPEQSCITLFFI